MIELHTLDFQTNIEAVIISGTGTVLWLIFHFFRHRILFGWLFSRARPALQQPSVDILSSKAGGLLWLGIVPVILFGLVFPVISLGWLSFSTSGPFFFWLAVLIPVVISVTSFMARKPAHQQQYPQLRENTWSGGLLLIDLLCWMIYLIGYEAFFRGFLLFGLAGVTSPWIAVMVSTMFYALAHIPKGWGESFGAIPFGVLLCLVSLTTGNFWAAFFIHLSLAWSNELLALRNHPSIISPLNRLH